MGGGTTLVEALANGGKAVGVDVSSLAAFVTETKTLTRAHNFESGARPPAIMRWTAQCGSVFCHRLPGLSRRR
jgi:hypothetical protein